MSSSRASIRRTHEIPIWPAADDSAKIHYWYQASQAFQQLCDDTPWADSFALNRTPHPYPCRDCFGLSAEDRKGVQALTSTKLTFPPYVRLKKPPLVKGPEEGLDMTTRVSVIKFGEFCEADNKRAYLDKPRGGGGPPIVDYTEIISAFRAGTLLARDQEYLGQRIRRAVNKQEDERAREILSDLGTAFNTYWLERGAGSFWIIVPPKGVPFRDLQVQFVRGCQVIGVQDEYHREVVWLWVKTKPPSPIMKKVIAYTLQLYRDQTIWQESWQAGVLDVLNQNLFLESEIDPEFTETYAANAEEYVRINRELQRERRLSRETNRMPKPPVAGQALLL